ncbi:MAG: hypothetical protein PHG51_07615, partial [Candidatus Omnitrophica bacterium]|nr:hypothetical protein [Candidatus Omnitrophota bacterium]
DREGKIYRTTLIAKMLCIIANKLASLDPFGTGIDMEADKPNWFDSLNGLPGLSGSSACETIELKRWVKFLSEQLEALRLGDYEIKLPVEAFDFLIALDKLVQGSLGKKFKDFAYWDKSNALKEEYRSRIHLGFSGEEKALPLETLRSILKRAEKKLAEALNKARDKKSGIVYSYFINQVIKYDFIFEKERKKLDHEGRPLIRPLEFKQVKLPLFLEGPMHVLRLEDDQKAASRLYRAIKKSRIFDRGLKMYKVTAPLAPAPLDIGRCRVFTPGWLENESVWLHMEYKYLLEVLKKGLYKEFYQDFYNCVVAFQDPARYGRSILENSSFLASSAFPDKELQGNGFVARLSGSTIEFLNILLLMSVGQRPFYLNKAGELNLKFSPILKNSLFSKEQKDHVYYVQSGKKINLSLPKNTYAFNFLKDTLVVYHNPSGKDTFGPAKTRISGMRLESLDNKVINLDGDVIMHPLADQVRGGEFKRIDIFLK